MKLSSIWCFAIIFLITSLTAIAGGVRVKVRNKSSGYMSVTFREANNENPVNDFVLLHPKGSDQYKLDHYCGNTKNFEVLIKEWTKDGKTSIEKKYIFPYVTQESWITVQDDKEKTGEKIYILKQGLGRVRIYPIDVSSQP